MIQVVQGVVWLRGHVSSAAFKRLAYSASFVVVAGAGAGLVAMQLLGWTQWTGRSLSLLDPTYAKKYIPIISSVSECVAVAVAV